MLCGFLFFVKVEVIITSFYNFQSLIEFSQQIHLRDIFATSIDPIFKAFCLFDFYQPAEWGRKQSSCCSGWDQKLSSNNPNLTL